MNSNELLSLIDAEIANLRQARAILAGLIASPANAEPSDSGARPSIDKRSKKRKLTPEGRARIAAAVKRRWAAQKAKQKTKS
jgi:hypothetical protein